MAGKLSEFPFTGWQTGTANSTWNEVFRLKQITFSGKKYISAEWMTPRGTHVLYRGPAMFTVVRNRPLSSCSSSLWWRKEKSIHKALTNLLTAPISPQTREKLKQNRVKSNLKKENPQMISSVCWLGFCLRWSSDNPAPLRVINF